MEALYKVLIIASCLCFTLVELVNICIVAEENICTSDQCNVNITIQELILHMDDTRISESIIINLCSENISLETKISVRNRSWISIEGLGHPSLITCNVTTSGFEFVNTTEVTMKNFQIFNCGAEHNSTSLNTSLPQANLVTRSSVYFLNSSNIRIVNVNISNSDGTGLSMVDNSGSVLIENCTFDNNTIHQRHNNKLPGGGGLYIEFSYCTPGGLTAGVCNGTRDRNLWLQNSRYVVRGCTFTHNTARSVRQLSTSYVRLNGNNFQGLGRGGGLCVHIRGYANNNTIDITECTFSHNSAMWGGGLYISVQDSPANNIIYVSHTILEENWSFLNGGGGIDVGFLFMNNSTLTRNKIIFTDCNIVKNIADYGGGTLVYSSPSQNFTDMKNEINFDACRWVQNRAAVAAGISIATHVWDTLKRGFLLSPSFKDCLFESNVIDNSLNFSSNQNIEGKGTLVAVGMDIKFEGSLTFTHNTDTALYLLSSNAEFARNSKVHFERNSGKVGGAISILGLSSLQIDDNSSFSFVDNKAREKGGAIYQLSHNINDYSISRSCFIQYIGSSNITNRAIFFVFKGNRAGFNHNEDTSTCIGHSIYAGTLHPCYAGCPQRENYQYKEVFNCIASFTFDKDTNLEISTVGEAFNLTEKDRDKEIVPGGWLELPILKDELGNKINALYHIFTANDTQNSVISLENGYTSNVWIKLYGSPGNTTTLRVETVDVWEVAVSLKIHMLECPPGYILTEITTIKGQKVNSCECSATSYMTLYTGIVYCNKLHFTTKLQIGYWLGYETDENQGQPISTERDLKSGYCPIGYCVHKEAKVLILPNKTDKDQLDKCICGNRTGRMCAYCRKNLSSHYHTRTFECKSNKKCNIGIPLYIVSEIIPITVLFLVITIFDISCTKGAVNGLIFYFQVTDMFIHISSGFVQCSAPTFEAFSFITGIFNLNFFHHRDLSFCLWEGAQTLDLLAFRYVSIIYSLLLVLSVIAVVRLCNVRKITQRLPKLFGREIGTKSTIIHGLSGFLVICYSESTKVSLLILTPVTVYGYDNNITAALYNGELDYFQGKHLFYATPALLFLITLGLGPPLLLLSYPLCYRIFGFLKIGESTFVKILCKCIPLEKFKPFYDSFQSSFKDKYRFYSGLYFAYRLMILLAFSITRSVTNFYVALIIGFSLILFFHTITQPYKNRWHNILDGYIFTTLIILSTLSFYSYRRALELLNNDHTIDVVCILQTIALYLPLVYFLLKLLKDLFMSIGRKLKEIRSRKRDGVEINLCEQELTDSLLYGRRRSDTEGKNKE